MFRALNEKRDEDDCSQDGSFKKPTKEAQEEEAMDNYNQAMVLFAQSKYEEAAQLFHDVLEGPYLNEINSSPKQIQFRLGCYKNLSKIYSSMKDPDYEASKSILLQAIEAEPNNTNLWYQLGQIGMKMVDFNLAFDGFSEALRCAPGHWSCIEKLIDISYITDDYISCLHYCAMGIGKDNAFLRGHVFRDIIFSDQPFYKDLVKKRIENPEQLTAKFNGDYNIEEIKGKYLAEINELKTKEKKIILDLKNNEKEERSKAFVNPTLKTNSLSAVIQNLLLINEAVKELGTFLRPVVLENQVDQNENENGIKKDSSSACNVDFNDSKSQNSPTSIDGKQQKESDAGIVQIEITNNENNDDYNQEEKPNNDDDVQNENEIASAKKKSKRDVRWWQIEGKRRSQRVKGIATPMCNNINSVKRKKEDEVFSDTLKNIIHSSFFYDESLEKDEDNTGPLEPTKVCEGDTYFGSLTEEMDVKNFFKENNNDNIVNIINNFLTFLCNEKNELVWPDELANGFIQLYQVYRSHTMLPDFSFDKDLPSFTLDTRITLTFLELVVDNFCSVKNSLNELSANTLHHLNEIIQENQDLVEYQNLVIRLYWAQSNLLLKVEKKNGKTSTFQQVYDYLQESLEKFKKFGLNVIKISTKKDNTISLAELVKKISCVENFRNIDQVHDLYINKKFAELIEILNYSQTSTDEVKNDELIHQFYLADAYFQMNQYHEAINQCVKILKFSSSNYQITSKCLSIIDSTLQIALENMSFQEHKKITNQVVQILITYASKVVVGRSSLYTLPWCILHKILSHYERMEPSIYLTEDTPNSIKLLQFAHECLSKNNKCLVDDGKLLMYTIEKISSCSEDYFYFEDTKHCIEQAIFCLYNHPHKKSRYLIEHNTSGLSCNLVWENCKDIYLYYKPEKLPEFDSFESINIDVATLYQRILSLMPEIYKPTEDEITNVLHFLDGKVDNLIEPRRDGSTIFPHEFNDIYFLVADYYWKAKEWKKVVEYSVFDLTLNPYRFDALIIVAMAKGAVLSEQFYSCNEYNPEDVIATSNQIAKCYEKSLMLDPKNSKIQLEFGSFIYGVHSFCSRLTKQNSEEMNMDKFSSIDSKKYEYLKKAAECFEHFHYCSTNEINIDEDDDVHEEIWFHHYMLGKIQEKLNKSDPANYLSQYELAGRLLHQLDKNNKSCPKKINYYNPPELAIETLEIYYRLHASILVYIEKHDYYEEKEKLLAEFIERASQTPFALGKSTDCDSKKSKKEDNRLIIKELVESIIDRVVRVVDVETFSNYSLMESQNQDSIINSQSKLSHLSTSSNIEKYGSIQMTKPVKTFEEGKFYQDFKDVKYGRLIAKCLEAFELCISRFPQHHKSYYRIALTYSNLLKNYSMSRVYYFGRFQDPCNQERKINGLFYDRKQNNIFNNVRRNPIEDIDRLGSFSYHMAKAIHHAIDILHHLKDYNLLNEIGALLSKQPESDKKYIYSNERQQLRDLAFSYSKSIKNSLPTPTFISNNNGNYSNISQEKSSANAYLKNINQNAICNGQAEENQFSYQQKQRQNINNLQSSSIGPAYNTPIPNLNISSSKINSAQMSTDGTWMSNNSTTLANRNNTNSINTRKEIPANKTSLSLNKNNSTKPVSSSVSSVQNNKEAVVSEPRNEINIQNKVPISKTSISNSNNNFVHTTKNQISTTATTTTTTSTSSYQQQQFTHRHINNTSPYQVQAKYLTNPSFVFQQHNDNDQSHSMAMAGSPHLFMHNPPQAHRSNHSHSSLKSPPRTQNNDSSSERNCPEIIDLTCKTPPKAAPFRFDPHSLNTPPKDDHLKIDTPSPKDPLKIDTPSPKEDPLKIDTPNDRLRIENPVKKRPPILDKRIFELQERKKAEEEERAREWKSVTDKSLKSLKPSKKINPNPLPNLLAIPGAANSSLLSRNKNESQMKKSTGNLNRNNVEEKVSLKRPMQGSDESYNSLPPKKKHLKMSKNIASNSNSTISSSISHQSTSSTSSQRSGFIFQDPSDPGKLVIKPQIIIID